MWRRLFSCLREKNKYNNYLEIDKEIMGRYTYDNTQKDTFNITDNPSGLCRFDTAGEWFAHAAAFYSGWTRGKLS